MPFDGSSTPADASSTAADGSSSTQIPGEQEASKNPNLAVIPGKVDGKLCQEDGLDLEKGVKVADNVEPAESEMGQASGGHDLKDADNVEPAESEMGQASGGHDLKDADEEDDGRCRVCHLVFDCELGINETMQLGCHCKEDLAIAHRDCAEAWFKIKGNRICEICGATAQNIMGSEDTGFMEQWNDAGNTDESQARCWQSLSLCNFFLACMVVTFILLWLFRVTIS